jgi:archaellum component FlaG (FlaF/FlaG flagellin family)
VLERGLFKSAHIVMFIELVSFIMKALILEYLKYHLVGIIAGVIKKRVEEVMNTVSSDFSIECSSDCRITAHLWPCPCDSETYLFNLERC